MQLPKNCRIIRPAYKIFCQRGMTLLESLFSLIVLIATLVIIANYLRQSTDQTVQLATARQLKKISHAAHAYLLDHFSEIDAQTQIQDQEIPIFITLPELQEAGYLTSTFIANQQYKIEVIKDEACQLQLWVTAHGTPSLSRRAWHSIGPLIGQQGGYIERMPSKPARVIGWPVLEEVTRPAALGPIPQTAQLVVYRPVHPSAVMDADGLLYRRAVPGSPQLNQMTTALRLQENQIIFRQGNASEAPAVQSTINAHTLHFQHTTVESENSHLLLNVPNTNFKNHAIVLKSQDRELYLTPTAVSLHAKTLPELLKPTYTLNSSQKTLTKEHTTDLPQYGSQLHQWWSKLPYHSLPPRYYGSKQPNNNIQDIANKICISAREEAIDRIGRLFMLGNTSQQQAAIYICGKSNQLKSSGISNQAYLVSSIDRLTAGSHLAMPISPPPKHTRLSTSDISAEKSQVVNGIKLPTQLQNNQQHAEIIFNFLNDFIPRARLFLLLEEEICDHKKTTRVSGMNNSKKRFADFYNLLKKDNLSLRRLNENPIYSDFFKELCKKYSKYPEPLIHSTIALFIQYYQNHRPESNPISPSTRNRDKNDQLYLSSHCKFLKSIEEQLRSCRNHNKTIDMEKFIKFYQSDNMKNFIRQCRNFNSIQDEVWASTLHLITTLVEKEHQNIKLLYD